MCATTGQGDEPDNMKVRDIHVRSPYLFIYYDLLHTIQIHKGNEDNKTNKKLWRRRQPKAQKHHTRDVPTY